MKKRWHNTGKLRPTKRELGAMNRKGKIRSVNESN